MFLKMSVRDKLISLDAIKIFSLIHQRVHTSQY